MKIFKTFIAVLVLLSATSAYSQEVDGNIVFWVTGSSMFDSSGCPSGPFVDASCYVEDAYIPAALGLFYFDTNCGCWMPGSFEGQQFYHTPDALGAWVEGGVVFGFIVAGVYDFIPNAWGPVDPFCLGFNCDSGGLGQDSGTFGDP